MATPIALKNKMSLVAQFDDLCRYSEVLMQGSELEFKQFVINQKKVFRKFKNLDAEIGSLKETITTLKKEKKKVELCMTQIKNLLATEVSKRKQLEQEKASMDRQIALIREVIMKDGGKTMDNDLRHFLLTSATSTPVPELRTIEESVESLLSPSDLDYTEDDLDEDIPKRKRRSKGNRKSSGEPKKRKSEGKPKEVDFEYMDYSPTEINTNDKRRSYSEPHNEHNDLPAIVVRPVIRSDSDQIKSNTIDVRPRITRLSATPKGRYSTGGKLSRVHAFVTKTVIRQEKCNACGRLIKFCQKALKCGDCRVVCHPECKDQCPLPCVPLTRSTPTKGEIGTISDYVSSTAPMIPSIIVHCINEIEARGMKEIGLYRVSGSERHVKDLKEKLLRGNLSTLSQCDIHAVCGTVKEFLRSLKEPLITQKAWLTFVEASDNRDIAASLNHLYDAVQDLPQPNKDTLAFLVLHFQRVAESAECRMSLQSLAKVLGPTVVGYSSSEPTHTNMLTETAQQCHVMERLLMISSEAWNKFLNFDMPDVFEPELATPENFQCMSRLGPIMTDSLQKPTVKVSRASLTPRKNKKKENYLSPIF